MSNAVWSDKMLTSSVVQATVPVGQVGKPSIEGADATGVSAMDGTEDEGETKPMED